MRLTATQVRNARGELLQIPNSRIAGQRLANISRTTAVKLGVTVRLPQDVPHVRAEDVLLRAAVGVAGIRNEPAPLILARSLAGGAMEYEIIALVNSPSRKAEAASAVLLRLQEICLAEGVRLL